MKNTKKSMKKDGFKKNELFTEVVKLFKQPFNNISSINTVDHNDDRINAHDLFSLYTADIIKEDVIFVR